MKHIHSNRHILVFDVRLERLDITSNTCGPLWPLCMSECGCTSVCFTHRYAAVKRSSLSFVTVTFKSFSKLGGSIYHRRPPPPHFNHTHPHSDTHTLTQPHTHSSDRQSDKPLTFTLQSVRSISRPFFHVMFTSLWAIWPQWGDCLWSTTCVYSGHFPCHGPSGKAIKTAQTGATFFLIESRETLGPREYIQVKFFLLIFVLGLVFKICVDCNAGLNICFSL